MRLGGELFAKWDDPAGWAAAVRAAGYAAARCPLPPGAGDVEVRAYERAAAEAGIVIAEVGAWSNPISPDPRERAEALEKNRRALDLADRIGARCCVNVAGSCSSDFWYAAAPANLSQATFDLIVETVRSIIDAVRPKRTVYAVETMPWIWPDSPAACSRLLKAVDRKAAGAHLDPVNLVSSPRLYFANADLIRECFRELGPRIASCHAKDILLDPRRLTVHLQEVAPGDGALDYGVYLAELARLPADTPLMLEHMSSEAEYRRGADYIRGVARRIGVSLS
jgi:sugar phosphate isomerase/epimerase